MSVQLIKNIISELLFDTRVCESYIDSQLVEFVYENIIFPEFIFEKLLIGEPITVPELRDILRKKIVNFEFIKLDGNVRPAKGTTMMKYIPSENHPTGMNPASDKVAAFWDMNKGAWRSVSNKSKEIVLKKDIETGKPKVVVSDKKPKEEPKEKKRDLKSGQSYNYTTNRGVTTDIEVRKELPNGYYQVYSPEFNTTFAVHPKRIGDEISGEPTPRPIPKPKQPIVRPSIRPEAPEPIPTKPEDIPLPPVEEEPLDIDNGNILAGEVDDSDIIAPGIPTPAKPNDKLGIEPEETPEEEPLPPKDHITFTNKNKKKQSPDDEEFETPGGNIL